jgi:hypothetical protein
MLSGYFSSIAAKGESVKHSLTIKRTTWAIGAFSHEKLQINFALFLNSIIENKKNRIPINLVGSTTRWSVRASHCPVRVLHVFK